MSKITGRIGGAMALVASMALAGSALGQSSQDNDVPNASLNIPANLQLFGKLDPNVRKPTAIVNDTVITGTDIDQRLALALAINNNAKPTAEELQQLRLRILSVLIDETLQVQEAKSHEIKVEPAEIDRRLDLISRNFQKTPQELRVYLRQVGSSEKSLRRQVEAQLYWDRYLHKRIDPFVNISDEEVKAIIDRIKAAQGSTEYHVKEIYLLATPANAQQIFAEARALMEQIQQGKRQFEEVAAARSDASTKSVGGDLGWVRPSSLPEALAQAAASMDINQIAGPIESPGGFSILYLADKRKVLTADPRDAVLSLRQLSLPFPAGTTQAQANAKVADFSKALQTIHGCGDVGKIAKSLGAEVVDNDSVRVRDLPAPLQEMMSKLQVGESSPPFGTPTDGVRSLVLCGRSDPQDGQLPGMEQMRNQMEQQALNLRAEHKLRDLRRDAIIEYR
ncbi:MAG: peptidylprolyl isomerase [Sphingomonas sp.]